jgi:hypothetical protein
MVIGPAGLEERNGDVGMTRESMRQGAPGGPRPNYHVIVTIHVVCLLCVDPSRRRFSLFLPYHRAKSRLRSKPLVPGPVEDLFWLPFLHHAPFTRSQLSQSDSEGLAPSSSFLPVDAASGVTDWQRLGVRSKPDRRASLATLIHAHDTRRYF